MNSLNQVVSLLELSPPPFIFINAPIASNFIVQSLLSALQEKIRFVHIDGISCFTPRLLYDTILNGLSQHTPSWDDGCRNWSEETANDSMDSFLHALKSLHASLCSETRVDKLPLALVIDKPERVKERMPDLLAPLTRLAELTQLDVSVVLVSEVRWEDIRPPLGAAIDPYYVDIPVPTKEVIIDHLVKVYSEYSQNSDIASTSTTPSPYDPILLQTYTDFIHILVDVCFLYTNDPHEIQYISSARWPGFIKPVLDAHRMNVEAAEDGDEVEFERPSTEVLLRLTRHFKPSLSLALEQLYPRLTNAADWARANESDAASLAKDGIILGDVEMDDAEEEENTVNDMLLSSPTRPRISKRIQEQKIAQDLSSSDLKDTLPLSASLPRLSQFILIAAYIASMNPPKSDLRLFGRAADDKKRRRRPVKRQMANAKPKSGPAKIPQRFLGPSPFPLERLIAILGSLVEENDPIASEINKATSLAPDGLDFRIPGERTDYEVTRVGVYASIAQLTSLRLLVRTTSVDKLDGLSAMFKCGSGAPSSYEVILDLARGLDVSLPDLIWDNAAMG
ncbi:origin recognition complex subunit 5 C-terminus-domain-containing protein [Lentinula raphanica]|uniref:Origin recognition complex subunit 5 C-terminus-domain-containing protein n=1 Tax=Lentinula raphanica TaxID=153919 RepID=A0AA38PB17_9AGAR|nr:origin recognition complex subunit 5 C-terminus-domain-containing protein [Lentinula raphanica]KAJ3975812.1 origin recognition complex subunit 5 C-terminus-domain-containing protein [Lentinula raphanica]